MRWLNRVVVVLLWAGLTAEAGEGPAVIKLWPGEPPRYRALDKAETSDHSEAIRLRHISEPSLTVFPAPAGKAPGAGVVICPGGGYGIVCYGKEGVRVAEWFNRIGVTAFVLKYRLPSDGFKHPVPLLDAQRALRQVRHRAGEWGLEPNRIGILGFSAGGHLASTAGTHFDPGNKDAPDPVDRVSCRPDFMVLVYPVITFEGPHAHMGSRNNLLGDRRGDAVLARDLSNHLRVTGETPPAFLVHARDDKGVPAGNSILFRDACGAAGVACELQLYEKGGHGFGLGQGDADSARWPEDCEGWLRRMGWLD